MKTIVSEHSSYDPLLGLEDAANYLGLPRKRLLEMSRTREIASVRRIQKSGSPVRFRLSALNAWIKAHEIKPLRQVGA